MFNGLFIEHEYICLSLMTCLSPGLGSGMLGFFALFSPRSGQGGPFMGDHASFIYVNSTVAVFKTTVSV